MKREEKLREIEAKLAKGEIPVLPTKTFNREGTTRSHKSSEDHVHVLEGGSGTLQTGKRNINVNGDYSEDEDRPKVTQLVV